MHTVLFLGFAVDDSYRAMLEGLDPSLLQLFIGPNSNYLEEIEDRGQRYIGKTLDDPTDTMAISLAKEHLLSVLKKLSPNHPHQSFPLWLLPLVIP